MFHVGLMCVCRFCCRSEKSVPILFYI